MSLVCTSGWPISDLLGWLKYQLTHHSWGCFFGQLGSLGGVLTLACDDCMLHGNTGTRIRSSFQDYWPTDLFCQLKAVSGADLPVWPSTTLLGFCVPVLSREYTDSCKTEVDYKKYQSLIPAPVLTCNTQPSRFEVRTPPRFPSWLEKQPRPSPLWWYYQFGTPSSDSLQSYWSPTTHMLLLGYSCTLMTSARPSLTFHWAHPQLLVSKTKGLA